MAQRGRNILKQYFETGDKPTQEQFADLIDSLFNFSDDGGAKLKQMLEALMHDNRLIKSAIRGAEFALNRRGLGDIYDAGYQNSSAMMNPLPGDFWIFDGDGDPNQVSQGDWVIALRSGMAPPFNFALPQNWQVVHFGDTIYNANNIDLQHHRVSPTTTNETLVVAGIHMQIFSITINNLTYYGKEDDGNFGNADFIYRLAGANTEIQINEGALGFQFQSSMTIDILYKLIPQ